MGTNIYFYIKIFNLRKHLKLNILLTYNNICAVCLHRLTQASVIFFEKFVLVFTLILMKMFIKLCYKFKLPTTKLGYLPSWNAKLISLLIIEAIREFFSFSSLTKILAAPFALSELKFLMISLIYFSYTSNQAKLL